MVLATLAAIVLIYLLMLIGRHRLFMRMHETFNHHFENMRRYYGGMLTWVLEHHWISAAGFLVFMILSCALLFPLVGEDFFPSVDAGQIRLHVRCPPGTRLEQTEEYFADVEDVIRKDIPPDEISIMLDNMGIPNSSINLTLSDMTDVSPAEGEILIALNPKHHPIEGYVEKLRNDLPEAFPHFTFFFAPADIATQVLNFGIPAPIDVQISGSQRLAKENEQLAVDLQGDLAKLPGVVDTHIFEEPKTPDIKVVVDRTLADQLGVTQNQVAQDLLISLSSSNQTAPNYWYDEHNGVNYNIYVQTPQYRNDTIAALQNTPIVPIGSNGTPDSTQLLTNIATLERQSSPSSIYHYDISPTYSVQMNVQGTDLGSVSKRVNKVVDDYRAKLPRGAKITIRGQVASMNSSFTALALGMIFAVMLVYFLMVVNFQSWIDPLIILMALPGAAAGILWMLFATRTTLSVPSLMGAIMSIGVATSNSILMITFANDQRFDEDGNEGKNAHDAALAAGITRLRPVIMTALAMIIGMLPMSLGLGEGGEQNAPLGRAVIGGLTMATFATLFFVPLAYSLLRKKPPVVMQEAELREPH
jgi:multidrug efflux pump subunit AcrB